MKITKKINSQKWQVLLYHRHDVYIDNAMRVTLAVVKGALLSLIDRQKNRQAGRQTDGQRQTDRQRYLHNTLRVTLAVATGALLSLTALQMYTALFSCSDMVTVTEDREVNPPLLPGVYTVSLLAVMIFPRLYQVITALGLLREDSQVKVTCSPALTGVPPPLIEADCGGTVTKRAEITQLLHYSIAKSWEKKAFVKALNQHYIIQLFRHHSKWHIKILL